MVKLPVISVMTPLASSQQRIWLLVHIYFHTTLCMIWMHICPENKKDLSTGNPCPIHEVSFHALNVTIKPLWQGRLHSPCAILTALILRRHCSGTKCPKFYKFIKAAYEARRVVHHVVMVERFCPIIPQISPLYKSGKGNKNTNSVALSPEANYTDWATATCDEI
jgi:hypothetical protein